MNLTDIQNQIVAVNKANGWYDDNRTFGEDIALIHSEASEALEAYRDGDPLDSNRYVQPNGDIARFSHVFASSTAGKAEGAPLKPVGVPSEMADIVIRVLDACHRWGIDIEAAIVEKNSFNATRGNRHGGKKL